MQHCPLPSHPSPRLSLPGQVSHLAAMIRPLLASRRFLLAMAAMLIVASGLAGLDLAYRYAELHEILLPPQFSLSEDGGLAERFEYGLTASIALLMAARYWRKRIAACAFAAWLAARANRPAGCQVAATGSIATTGRGCAARGRCATARRHAAALCR